MYIASMIDIKILPTMALSQFEKNITLFLQLLRSWRNQKSMIINYLKIIIFKIMINYFLFISKNFVIFTKMVIDEIFKKKRQ